MFEDCVSALLNVDCCDTHNPYIDVDWRSDATLDVPIGRRDMSEMIPPMVSSPLLVLYAGIVLLQLLQCPHPLECLL